MASDDSDVIVFGGGPTELTMANLLAMKHHRVAVFERQRPGYALPRAGHMQGFQVDRVEQTDIGVRVIARQSLSEKQSCSGSDPNRPGVTEVPAVSYAT